MPRISDVEVALTFCNHHSGLLLFASFVQGNEIPPFNKLSGGEALLLQGPLLGERWWWSPKNLHWDSKFYSLTESQNHEALISPIFSMSIEDETLVFIPVNSMLFCLLYIAHLKAERQEKHICKSS